MKHEWIYRTTGLLGTDHDVGPVTEPEMFELAEKGKLALKTLVFSPTSTQGKWHLLSQVPALAAAFHAGERRRQEQEEATRKLEEMVRSVAPPPPLPGKTEPDSSTDVESPRGKRIVEDRWVLCQGCGGNIADNVATCPHCGLSAKDSWGGNYSSAVASSFGSRLMPSIPRPLVTNASAEESAHPSRSLVRYRLQVSARILSWPRHCACCGNSADTEMRVAASKTKGTRVVRTTTSWWNVPHCTKCVEHIHMYQAGRTVLIWGTVIAVVAAGIGFFASHSTGVGILSGLATFVGFFIVSVNVQNRASSMTCASCASADTAVQYVGWHGTVHEFVFSNEEYAKEFAAANRGKTMSDIRPVY